MKMPKAIAVFLLALLCSACGKKAVHVADPDRDLAQILTEGKLVAITMYGSTSYFQHRDQTMGFQYELCRALADDLGVELEFRIAQNQEEMMNLLLAGEGDLVAYRCPVLAAMRDKVNYLDEEYMANQVLVQSISDTMITGMEQLVGKEIHVPCNSKYAARMYKLSEEFGGTLRIVDEDTLTTDELIEKVARHQIPFTVADEEIAAINKTYFRNLDYSISVGIPQRCTWAVRQTSPELYAKANEWMNNFKQTKRYTAIYRKYFVNSKYLLAHNVNPYFTGKGISPFDELFRKYAKRIDWDWRLLMAVAYQESKFDPNAQSWSGAKGLMQLTVPTAQRMGLDEEEIYNPEKNLRAAVKNIAQTKRIFKKIPDKNEQTKFVLAAYNAGVAHIFDARAMAEKDGKNRDVWDDVAPYLILKSDSTYFSDTTLCKYGYSRGNETVDFVEKVLGHYERYKETASKDGK